MRTELNNQYLDETAMSNYFGGLNGETEEQQTAMREAWIDEMAKRGFPMGCEICNEDGEFADGFERAAQDAIDASGRRVFRERNA
jgi:hypothetical protein